MLKYRCGQSCDLEVSMFLDTLSHVGQVCNTNVNMDYDISCLLFLVTSTLLCQ